MYPDSQPIAGMRRFRDASGEVVFEYLLGNVPLVISAPHAGWKTYDPTGSEAFGSLIENAPADQPTAMNLNRNLGLGSYNGSSGDFGTRYITFGIARRLVARGLRPHVIVGRLKRNRVDLNRPWGFQHHWELSAGSGNPPLVTTPDGIDPEFQRTYYWAYHQFLTNMVRKASDHGGWLFDIHGEAGANSFRFATHRGVTAQADALYSGSQCLTKLVQNQGLNATPDSVTAEASGYSYIAGFLHGATPPSRLGSVASPPVPPAGRVNGVHVEIARSYRFPPGATDYNYMNNITIANINWLEDVGGKFGEALFEFLAVRNLI
jgi:hypothetical protein